MNYLLGAGVSVSGGIPDFRSHNGLYDVKVGTVKGKDMFDAALFKSEHTTRLFYNFVLDLKTMVNKATITKTHEFIKELGDMKKLMRVYTQNIDDLDKRAGLLVGDELSDNVIQLHGELETVYCTFCKISIEFCTKVQKRFSELDITCPSCQDRNEIRKAAGKRLHTVGALRPNIVLYNEYHPKGMRLIIFR